MVTHILPEVFIYLERSQPPKELHLVVMSRDVVMGILCDLLKGEGLLL